MTEHQPQPGTELCRLDEIADGTGRVFTWGSGKDAYSVVVVRRGETASAFVNVCPHFHIPLDHHGTVTTFGEFVLCSHHYAAFRADDGYCVEGPCEDAALTAVPLVLEHGCVRLGLASER